MLIIHQVDGDSLFIFCPHMEAEDVKADIESTDIDMMSAKALSWIIVFIFFF